MPSSSSPLPDRPDGCRSRLECGCCVLRQWPPTSELSPQGLDEWIRGWRANSYARGNVLFYQGNEPLGIFFVCSGSVKLVRSDGTHRQQIVRVVRAPELLGERAFVAGQTYEASAEAAEDARVCFMDAERFRALWNGESGVGRLVARRLAQRLGQAQENLAEMGLRTIRERLARLIARALEAAPQKPVWLYATRQELAEILGTSAEVVCRALGELERKGLIALEGHHARVLDEVRLRALASMALRPDDFYQSRDCRSSSSRDTPVNDNDRRKETGLRSLGRNGRAKKAR